MAESVIQKAAQAAMREIDGHSDNTDAIITGPRDDQWLFEACWRKRSGTRDIPS
jgi:hypothetical protein